MPSVTTVLKRFKESDRLLFWAWRLGAEGLDYRKVRDGAASVGSAIHTASEKWLGGLSVDGCEDGIVRSLRNNDHAARALLGFESVRRWVQANDIEVLETEVPFVSERHRFAGCVDWILRGHKQLDLKSGKGVYTDHLLQLAAYNVLYEENRGESFADYTILHIPQDGGDCVPYRWQPSQLLDAQDMFLDLLSAYHREDSVKTALKEAKDVHERAA